MVQLSHPYMTTGKNIALTRPTFVGKVMPLHFNMLSRFVIAFLPRSTHLLISWLQSPSTVILEPKKRKCHCFHCFPIYLSWSDGIGCQDLIFLNVEFSVSFYPLSPSSRGSLVLFHGSQPCHGEGACITHWSYEPCPCKVTQDGRVMVEFWQNLVQWRRHWPTTSVFLLWEPCEQNVT